MSIQGPIIGRALSPQMILLVALSLGACSSDSGETQAGNGAEAADTKDCEVLAAIAKDHYRFDTTTNRPPPLKFDSEGAGWAPACEWARHGLAFTAFAPSETAGPEEIQFVSFKRPTYRSDGATVETGIIRGPLDGRGSRCQLKFVDGDWRLVRCDEIWIS